MALSMTGKMIFQTRNFREFPSKLLPLSFSTQAKKKRPSWDRAVLKAEEIVAHNPFQSSMSASMLQGDLMTYVARLMGTPHAFLRVVKKLIYDGKNSLQTRGLIILLLSKITGQLQPKEDDVVGISQRQRSLATLVEMIHAGQEIHRAISNLSPQLFPDPEMFLDMNQANKVAVLTGDYLMATASLKLGYLYEPKVVELIAIGMTDFSEGEFLGERDLQGAPLPTGESTIDEWHKRSYLRRASLLSKACQSAMILAGHGAAEQVKAATFGEHLAHAMQASGDLYYYTNLRQKIIAGPLDLVSAPVILHLQHDRALLEYILTHRDNVLELDYRKIHAAVLDGPGVVETKKLCREHSLQALELISTFDRSAALSAMEDLIYAVHDTEDDTVTTRQASVQ